MSGSSDDFGTSTLSARELRSMFVVLAVCVVLLLLFGVGLAVRLQSSAETLREGMPASSLVDAPDGPANPVGSTTRLGTAGPDATGSDASGTGAIGSDTTVAGTAESVEEISTDRAVLPAEAGGRERYGVRVGIFEVPENADRILVRLQAAGYAPFVVFQTSDGRTLRYVYAATAESEDAAASLAGEIANALGLETYIESIAPIR